MLLLFGRSLPQNLSRYFSDRAAQDGHRVIFASMGNFPSSEAFSELRALPAEDLKGQPVVVFQSFAQAGEFSANDYFVQMLWAGDTLKRYGAGPLWAIAPFGPYTRQDQERAGKMDSVACEAAAKHLAMDFEGLSAIELHSEKARKLMEDRFGQGRVFSIDPTEVFLRDLQTQSLQNPVVVSPDKGANARADTLAKKLGADRFYVDKERSEIVNTKVAGSSGDVENRDAVMVDDMADTFGTGANSAKLVRSKGASRIFFYSAHPVLSGPAWDRLAKLMGEGDIDRVRFGNTIARNAEAENFAQQYGPDIADKIGFLGMEEVLYNHVNKVIAHHPAMKI